ncbi:uncharacterized protein RCO7_14552 [Rhynchosporium graminicola]|uniref:Uncharacterized protein n=1 Tax=Rhynchosporium graminicola TaxID=2792576 RepID=A0A1E1KNJ9_9HELO|nr:uncharacterized protein RCO7_14552 [Rhynchosporium commune]
MSDPIKAAVELQAATRIRTAHFRHGERLRGSLEIANKISTMSRC